MIILKSTKLYKYLKYSDDTLKIITYGTIKFSDPTTFNDPFDSQPCYDPSIAEHIAKTRPDLMAAAASYRGISVEEFIKEQPHQRLAAVMESGQYSKEVAGSVGICSLTRDPLNLLMWAHYADEHKGFVVEFDIPEETTEHPTSQVQFVELLIPQEVEYVAEMPIILATDDRNAKFTKQFLTKGLEWKYEAEERVIDYIRKSGIHKLDQRAILSSIITGLNMDQKIIDIIKNEVSNLNKRKGLSVTVHHIEKVSRKFAIFVPDRPDIKSPNANSAA